MNMESKPTNLDQNETMPISESNTVLGTTTFASSTTSSHSPEMGHSQLIDNFHSIVETQSIYYPVAYRFQQRIGSGQQGVVFHAQRHGSRGCVTEHAVKVFDPGIYPNVEKYWTDMGRIAAQVSRLQATRSLI